MLSRVLEFEKGVAAMNETSKVRKAHDQLVNAIKEETGFIPAIEIRLIQPDDVPGGL